MFIHSSRLSGPALPSLAGLGIGMVLVLLVGGCGGGDTYTVDQGTLSERFLPATRSLEHHPDSLRVLTIRTEEDSTISYELDGDYESLLQKWSSTYQDLGSGRNRRGRSYATLWGKELTLASLQPEMGIQGLSGDQAHEVLEERREQYQETLQIDVFWFESEGSSILAGPGTRVRLRVGGTEYEPSNEDYGPLREAFLQNGNTGLYRRNTFYFDRMVDGEDILAIANEVELIVGQSGIGSRIRFRWAWDTEQAFRRGGEEGMSHAVVRERETKTRG